MLDAEAGPQSPHEWEREWAGWVPAGALGRAAALAALARQPS